MNSRENEGKIKKKEWKKGAWSFFSPFFLILTINYRFTNKKLIKKNNNFNFSPIPTTIEIQRNPNEPKRKRKGMGKKKRGRGRCFVFVLFFLTGRSPRQRRRAGHVTTAPWGRAGRRVPVAAAVPARRRRRRRPASAAPRR